MAGARKFSVFWDWVDRTKFVDKLIVRFHLHHEAHAVAMKYFNEHKEYDSMIISSDDVLGTPDHVRLLIEDELKHGFSVVSGWCNIMPDKPWASLSMKINPVDLKNKRMSYQSYNFVNVSDVVLNKYGYPFFKTFFVGLPLTLVRREVLEKFPFRPFMIFRDHWARFASDPKVQVKGRGIMFDTQFAVDCAAYKVPIVVDSRLFLYHFGLIGKHIMLGKAQRSVEFVKATEEM